MPHTQAATIQHIVYLGTVTHFYTRTVQGEEVIAYVQNQELACGPHTFAVGAAVTLSWKPESVLVVEAD